MKRVSLVLMVVVVMVLALAGIVVSAETQTPTLNPTLRGDANCDGIITIDDGNAIATMITGGAPLSPQGYVNAASVTKDKISINDALFIAQYVAGQRDIDFNLK